MSRPLAAAVAAVALAPAAASAAPWRASAGAGWSASITGPSDHGPAANLALFPGGRDGRLGAGIAARGFEGLSAGWVAGGLVYRAAAARPHIEVELHAEAGAAVPDALPVIGGGARWHIWVVGPLAVGADTGAHLLADGLATQLALSATLTLTLTP